MKIELTHNDIRNISYFMDAAEEWVAAYDDNNVAGKEQAEAKEYLHAAQLLRRLLRNNPELIALANERRAK